MTNHDRSLAACGEALEEAGEVEDVQRGCGCAAVAVGPGVGGGELLEEAGEVGDVECGGAGAGVAVGVAQGCAEGEGDVAAAGAGGEDRRAAAVENPRLVGEGVRPGLEHAGDGAEVVP